MSSKLRRFAPRSSVVLALIGLVCLASGAATWFYPPEFTARMKLHVAPNPPTTRFPDKDGDEVRGYTFARSQADNIRDRFTILAAMREPGIANLSMLQQQKPNAEQWLEEHIVVAFPSPQYMSISLSGDQGDELIKIVAAVTKAYLDNYVNKENNARVSRRKEVELSRDAFEKKMTRLKEQLRDKQQAGEAIDTEGVIFLQQLARDELHSIRKRIVEVHERLIILSVEMGFPPDWEERAGPAADQMIRIQSVLGLRSAPTPGSSVHFALTALLRLQIPEGVPQRKEYRLLKAMEARLLREAEALSKRTEQKNKQAADLSQWHDEIAAVRKVVQSSNEQILRMDVEQQAPARITKLYDQPILIRSNETKRKMTMVGAPALAGLGMILLVLAVSQFRADQGHDSVEHPPTASPPE